MISNKRCFRALFGPYISIHSAKVITNEATNYLYEGNISMKSILKLILCLPGLLSFATYATDQGLNTAYQKAHSASFSLKHDFGASNTNWPLILEEIMTTIADHSNIGVKAFLESASFSGKAYDTTTRLNLDVMCQCIAHVCFPKGPHAEESCTQLKLHILETLQARP